jgi:hypothetical protein
MSMTRFSSLPLINALCHFPVPSQYSPRHDLELPLDVNMDSSSNFYQIETFPSFSQPSISPECDMTPYVMVEDASFHEPPRVLPHFVHPNAHSEYLDGDKDSISSPLSTTSNVLQVEESSPVPPAVISDVSLQSTPSTNSLYESKELLLYDDTSSCISSPFEPSSSISPISSPTGVSPVDLPTADPKPEVSLLFSRPGSSILKVQPSFSLRPKKAQRLSYTHALSECVFLAVALDIC